MSQDASKGHWARNCMKDKGKYYICLSASQWVRSCPEKREKEGREMILPELNLQKYREDEEVQGLGAILHWSVCNESVYGNYD